MSDRFGKFHDRFGRFFGVVLVDRLGRGALRDNVVVEQHDVITDFLDRYELDSAGYRHLIADDQSSAWDEEYLLLPLEGRVRRDVPTVLAADVEEDAMGAAVAEELWVVGDGVARESRAREPPPPHLPLVGVLTRDLLGGIHCSQESEKEDYVRCAGEKRKREREKNK